MHLQLRRDYKEGYMKVGERKAGVGCALLMVVSLLRDITAGIPKVW